MNWIIMKPSKERKEEKIQEPVKIFYEKKLETASVDKDQLEADLNTEINTLSNKLAGKTFKKQRDKKEAQRLAGELTATQKSLNDANNKAATEKTELLKQLKELNTKLKNPLTPADEDIQTQLDAIKGRLNYILEIERKDVLTVLEARQAQHLQDLKDKNLVLNDEEKKALDFSAGYYYHHSKGNKDNAKSDKEALEKYLNDNKDKITNDSVLFSIKITIEHFNEEEKHGEDNHKYLKDLADLNNRYTELDNKYKEVEAAKQQLDRANDEITRLGELGELKENELNNFKNRWKKMDDLASNIKKLSTSSTKKDFEEIKNLFRFIYIT